jgi:hypothetical protein
MSRDPIDAGLDLNWSPAKIVRPEDNPNRLPASERYQRDPAFHALVELIYGAICRCDYTPTEIREAAMYAAIRYEQQHIRPVMVPLKDKGQRTEIGF